MVGGAGLAPKGPTGLLVLLPADWLGHAQLAIANQHCDSAPPHGQRGVQVAVQLLRRHLYGMVLSQPLVLVAHVLEPGNKLGDDKSTIFTKILGIFGI